MSPLDELLDELLQKLKDGGDWEGDFLNRIVESPVALDLLATGLKQARDPGTLLVWDHEELDDGWDEGRMEM